MTRDELLDLIPAYALGALDPDERASVEALLQTDAEAQLLFADYEQVAEWMVLSTPARRAPTRLQDDLKRRLATSPQPPAARRIIPLWTLAAAAAVFVVIVGALLLTRPAAPTTPEQLFQQIAARPDALRIPIAAAEGIPASGELIASPDGTQAVIRVANLPTLTADQIYQLWLVDDSGVMSGGLLSFPDPQRENFIVLPISKPIQDYAGFGVSLEPAGGSPLPDGPSGPRMFGVSVQNS